MVPFFGLPPRPDSLIEAMATAFDNEKFILSAWPQLAHKQRQEIAQELRLNQRFENAVKKVVKEPTLINTLLPQAISLDKFYKYLKADRRRCQTAGRSRYELWDLVSSMLQRDSSIAKDTPDAVVKELRRVSGDKNRRSDLYHALTWIELGESLRLREDNWRIVTLRPRKHGRSSRPAV